MTKGVRTTIPEEQPSGDGDVSGHGSRTDGGVEGLEARWEEAGRIQASDGSPSVVDGLDGTWEVQRLTGPVPMRGIYKVASAGRGRTGAGWSPFGDAGFRLEQHEDSVILIYDSPLSFMRDEFRKEADGSWLGRARAGGRQYAWFRMVPYDSSGPRSGARLLK